MCGPPPPRAQLVAIGHHWLGQVYGQGPNREWAYGRVPPRIIVEEFLTTQDRRHPG